MNMKKRRRERNPPSQAEAEAGDTFRKRQISSPELDFFDGLPDDLVLSVLSKLSSSADSPSDLISISLTCKRMMEMEKHDLVLKEASRRGIAIKAEKWSESSHRFLISCCDAGNIHACYFLGMIRFYCMNMRASGAALMARAALGSHAAAVFSLAVVRFNGSGGTAASRNPRAGFVLSARAALLGHVDAIREVGHCFVDGHGAPACPSLGRRFLVDASARELLTVSSGMGFDPKWVSKESVPGVDPVNGFIREWWFGSGLGGDGLRMCSNGECGRRETRKHEFRRCAACGGVNYCSRACQARHWSGGHKDTCRERMDVWDLDVDAAAAAAGGGLMAGIDVASN